MRPVTGRYRRPFLALGRDVTRRACVALGIETWADPANDDERFARVRVRTRLLPEIEGALGPGVAEALARTAEAAAADTDALDAMAAQAYQTARVAADGAEDSAEDSVEDSAEDRAEVWMDVASLTAAVPAIRTRVLRLACLAAGVAGTDLARVHILELERLVTDWHGQGPIELPGGVHARRDRARLVVSRAG